MNQANIIGRITKDLELRTTGSGKNVCEFTIAVSRVGNENTDFINCRVWDKQAENLVKYQKKGSLIAVSGSIRVDNYKTEQGETRYKTYVLANNIAYLSTKSSEEVSKEEEFDSNLSKSDVETIIDDDDLPF
jgi:single-strand DNA-binding protein